MKTNFKLSIDLLPKGAWGNNFSRSLDKKDWDAIRHYVYKNANYACEICGFKTKDLDAHEVWDFCIDSKTQNLKNIIALCSSCHGVKHMRNSERIGYGQNAKRHFMRINNCSELDFANHYTQAQLQFDLLNTVYRWRIIADLDKFGGSGVEIKEKYVPFIVLDKTSDIKRVNYNSNSYIGAPKIRKAIIDNYQGTLNIVCDDALKVEFYLDNKKIKTKFNVIGRFITEFKVENLVGKKLQFKLTGTYGETLSSVYLLLDEKELTKHKGEL